MPETKVTLHLDPEIVEAGRRLAAARGQSLSDFVEQSLRAQLMAAPTNDEGDDGWEAYKATKIAELRARARARWGVELRDKDILTFPRSLRDHPALDPDADLLSHPLLDPFVVMAEEKYGRG